MLAAIPPTRTTSGPGIRGVATRRMSTAAIESSPTARVGRLVSGSSSIRLASWTWIGPLAPGTPSSLGSWPMTIVIARPKTKPVTTDLAMKSEMNPEPGEAGRRGGSTPTTSASPAVSAR